MPIGYSNKLLTNMNEIHGGSPYGTGKLVIRYTATYWLLRIFLKKINPVLRTIIELKKLFAIADSIVYKFL